MGEWADDEMEKEFEFTLHKDMHLPDKCLPDCLICELETVLDLDFKDWPT